MAMFSQTRKQWRDMLSATVHPLLKGRAQEKKTERGSNRGLHRYRFFMPGVWGYFEIAALDKSEARHRLKSVEGFEFGIPPGTRAARIS